MEHQQREGEEEDIIVIVGAGLAGLAVALGLHRKGVRSVVLESSPALRASGFALAVWPNAFRALDALGVGDRIRELNVPVEGLRVVSSSTGQVAGEVEFSKIGGGGMEFRCVRRDLLLQELAAALPTGTIRYSSKIVSIDDDDDDHDTKQQQQQQQITIRLADGSTLKPKVLIGCEGIHSVVSRWLGLAKPSYSGRWSTRGLGHFPGGHTFKPRFLQFFGQGFRFGYLPCNASDIYWFYTWSPSNLDYLHGSTANDDDDDGVVGDAAKMKQYVLTKLRSSMVPAEALELVQRSVLSEEAPATPLRFRSPLSLLFANISKGNVCVAGDALHPMTPDLGQGGCSALEDGVVLARCLGDAILSNVNAAVREKQQQQQQERRRIESGLRKYARIRRWRSIQLIGTAYVVGFFQQSSNVIVSFLRDKLLAGVIARRLVKMTHYHCGTLTSSSSS